MTTGDDSYPSNWPGARPSAPSAAAVEALQMTIDSYIAALTPEEFDQLVQRTRS